MKPGKREEKQLEGTQTLQQGKPPIKNLPRTAGVAEGGGQKDSTANKPQKSHYGKANRRRSKGEHRRLHKEEAMPKTSRGPLAWRGGR